MRSQADTLQALIGQALRKCRRDAEMSREELAYELDVSAQRVADYEDAEADLDAAVLWRICRTLGLSIDDFSREVSALRDPTPGLESLRHGPLAVDPVIASRALG